VETTLSGIHDLMTEQSIDYILEFVRDDIQDVQKTRINSSKKMMINTNNHLSVEKDNENYNEDNFRFDPSSMKVEEFFVEGQEFSTMSDHFGLSIYLNIDN
jgi:hypothetical protein